MNKILKYYTKSLIMAGCCLIFMILALVVDKQAVGPLGSAVGFGTINAAVFNFLGTSKFWDVITDLIAGVSLLTAAAFAVYGLIQLIKSKSFKKVDTRIYILAGLYVALLIVYVFFDKILVINYRPVLEDGALEPSFPSSHTILVLVVMISAMTMTEQLFPKLNKQLQIVVYTVCVLSCVLMVIGRLCAGIHWFTDIIGAILISAGLLAIFKDTLKMVNEWKQV